MVKKIMLNIGVWIFIKVLKWVDDKDKAEEFASKLLSQAETKLGIMGLNKDIQNALAGIMTDIIRAVYGANMAGYREWVKNLKEKI